MRMLRFQALLVFWFLGLQPGISPLLAIDIVPASAYSRMAGGAGQTITTGSSSIFFNPGNLFFEGTFEPYVDVSALHAVYSYAHSDHRRFKPVDVNVNTMPVTAGFGYRPMPELVFGIAIQPTGIGQTQVIREIPIEIAGETQDYDAVYGTSGVVFNYLAGLGGAYRISDEVSVGFGVLRTEESKVLKVYSPDSVDSILDAAWGGAFHQFILGLRSELFEKKLILATSYRSGVAKRYHGSMKHLLTNGQFVVMNAVGYNPATFGLGVEVRHTHFGAFGDYRMESYIPSRNAVRTGLPNCAQRAELRDVSSIVLGAKAWLGNEHLAMVGYGYYPDNVGNGRRDTRGDQASPAGTENDAVDGVLLGMIEAIPRQAYSAGYRYKAQAAGGTMSLISALYYTAGKRTVPVGFPNEGDFGLKLYMGSVAVAFDF